MTAGILTVLAVFAAMSAAGDIYLDSTLHFVGSSYMIGVSTNSIASGTWGDTQVAVSTKAITSGTFGDARVSISTAGVISGTFGDSRILISSAAMNNPPVMRGGDNMTGQLTTTSTLTVQGNAFSVGGSTLIISMGQVGILSTPAAGEIFRVGGGTLTVNQSGHVLLKGTAPTISSCGTSPGAAAGNDHIGRVTSGTANPASCTVTFKSGSWTNAPACLCNDETRALSCSANSVTTTSVVLKSTSVFSSSDVLSWMCFGF